MCEASKMAPDWVLKGCHIHVRGVELRVFPDHRGRIGFSQFFSGENSEDVSRAIREAIETCLPDPQVRKKWEKKLESMIAYMMSFEGTLARGRMAEFNFLKIAINRYQE